MKPSAILLFILSCFFSINLKATDSLITSRLDVYYATGEYKLDEHSSAEIRSFLLLTQKPLLYSIEVRAYTDSNGTVKSNDVLAVKRAEELKKFLLDSKVNPSCIKTYALGETVPEYSNDEQTKWKNRRVSITLTQRDCMQSFGTEKQVFHIDQALPSVIEGKHGTKIIIPAHSLVRKNGAKVYGKVDIELYEYYTKSDFLLNKLPVTSGGQILESGGTVFIKALSNNQELKVNNGKQIQIRMPSSNLKDEMQAFFGVTNDSTHRVNDWQLNAAQGSLVNQSRRVDFAQAEGLLVRQATNWNGNVTYTPAERELIAFFGEPGNEEELGILLGNAIKKRSNQQMQRLVELYNIEMVVPGRARKDAAAVPDDNGEGSSYAGYSIVYRKKTGRMVDFAEATFKDMDFDNIDIVKFSKDNVKYEVELTREKMNFEKPLIVNDYLIKTNTLNWINCDRFSNENVPKVFVVAGFDSTLFETLNAYLVFKDINSVMAGSIRSDGQVFFPNIPEGKKAWLFAYVITDGELRMFKKEIVAGEKNELIVPTATTEKDFKESVALLDM